MTAGGKGFPEHEQVGSGKAVMGICAEGKLFCRRLCKVPKTAAEIKRKPKIDQKRPVKFFGFLPFHFLSALIQKDFLFLHLSIG